MSSGIGIVGVATYIPEGRLSSKKLNRKFGVPLGFLEDKMGLNEKPVAGPDEHPSDLGLRAAEKLIARGGLDPKELNLIVYASSGLSDYQFWSPAARIQREIGADKAFCFELNNGCNAGNAALNVIDAMMKANPHIESALLVVSDTLSKFVDHSNPDSYHLANLSDGAAAILLRREGGRLEVLAHDFMTDSRYVDYYKVLQGGTKALAETGLRKSVVPEKIKKTREEGLGAAYKRNYRGVIETALQRSGLSADRIDYLFLNQGDRNLVGDIQTHFMIPDSRMHNSFADFGHIGGVDVFLAMENLLERDGLETGAHVVIGSSAIGFSWGATVLKYKGIDSRRRPS